MKYVFDVFYQSKDKFSEHIQIESEDLEALMEDRRTVAEALVKSGATQRDQDKPRTYGGGGRKFPAKSAQPASPMEAAARASIARKDLKDAPTKDCPEGHGRMNFRPGTAYTGRVSGPNSKNPGSPYSSIYECETCGAKEWANDQE